MTTQDWSTYFVVVGNVLRLYDKSNALTFIVRVKIDKFFKCFV